MKKTNSERRNVLCMNHQPYKPAIFFIESLPQFKTNFLYPVFHPTISLVTFSSPNRPDDKQESLKYGTNTTNSRSKDCPTITSNKRGRIQSTANNPFTLLRNSSNISPCFLIVLYSFYLIVIFTRIMY